MSFLDGSSHSALLDCSEGDMKPGAWGGTDLLDPGGDAADFDISSFFSQLAASTTAVEAQHGTDTLCGPGVSSAVPLAVPPADRGEQLCAASDAEEAHTASAGDVSLSAILGEHAELQAALLAASEPPPPPPVTGKTFVVVKKQQQQRVTPARRRQRVTPPYGRPPAAPLSAYNTFFKEQYAQLKARWSCLNVKRAIPRLSGQWGRMTPEEKQSYLLRAEDEKAEYRTQLAQYRQRARLWRRHKAPVGAVAGAAAGSEAAAGSAGMVQSKAEAAEARTACVEEAGRQRSARCPASSADEEEEVHSDDDPADLYCSLCDVYVSSSHNKQEHLHSRRHVRNIALQAAAREAAASGAEDSAAAAEDSSSDSAAESTAESAAESTAESTAESAADVPGSLESVLHAVSRREKEIQFLSEFIAELARKQRMLQQQLAELEARRVSAVTSQQCVTSQHRQLTEQAQGLLLVPTLFGVMSQWGRDAQRAASAISVRQGKLEV